MDKTFTAKEIGEAITEINARYPGNPEMPVAYIMGELENLLDIL